MLPIGFYLYFKQNGEDSFELSSQARWALVPRSSGVNP